MLHNSEPGSKISSAFIRSPINRQFVPSTTDALNSFCEYFRYGHSLFRSASLSFLLWFPALLGIVRVHLDKTAKRVMNAADAGTVGRVAFLFLLRGA